MKRIIIPAVLLALSSSFAFAQPDKSSQRDPSTPAIAAPDTKNPTAPVEGANSFTEDQAKERIQEKGFKDVSGLTKDNNGIWRGKAAMNGAMHSVAVDYQGNVTHK